MNLHSPETQLPEERTVSTDRKESQVQAVLGVGSPTTGFSASQWQQRWIQTCCLTPHLASCHPLPPLDLGRKQGWRGVKRPLSGQTPWQPPSANGSDVLSQGRRLPGQCMFTVHSGDFPLSFGPCTCREAQLWRVCFGIFAMASKQSISGNGAWGLGSGSSRIVC